MGLARIVLYTQEAVVKNKDNVRVMSVKSMKSSKSTVNVKHVNLIQGKIKLGNHAKAKIAQREKSCLKMEHARSVIHSLVNQKAIIVNANQTSAVRFKKR